MDLVTILLMVIGVLVIATGLFTWQLHKKGVPTAALPGQVALKAEDVVDSFEEKVVALLQKHNVAMSLKPASLKDAYFDRDDFMQDVGRLTAASQQMVRLDGATVRNGNSPSLDYYLQANGNITHSAPIK